MHRSDPLPGTGARAPLARRDQAGIELLQQIVLMLCWVSMETEQLN